MDLLLAAGYDSSSSSSSSSSQLSNKNNDSLREGNAQNAVRGHNSPCLGHNDDSSPSTADGNAAKKRSSCHPPRSPAAVKKQKSTKFITIASCDNDCQQSDQSFERSNPHIEGRWAGHIYLPFPNFDSCDTDDHIHDELNTETDAKILADEDSDRGSDESSVSSIEDECLQASRSFLPAARTLIYYWEALLNEVCVDIDDNISGSVIVPHVSMSPKKSNPKSIQTSNKQDIQNNNTYLHISLSRPIYLPAPSVDSFLADISSSMASLHSAARRQGHCNSHKGKTIHLRPHNATIFVNDNQTRSFLSIPVSDESSRWAKRLLLPPIDATMLRFGQKTYYDEGIMHVSIASVKGNMIPIILKKRKHRDLKHTTSGNESNISSIPLFQSQGCNQFADETRSCIPESIPIRLDRIQCDFGKVKNMALPL
eukprot:scaffold40964_cov155-Skeletonema_dohrnii-CCMP3373.AAC.2